MVKPYKRNLLTPGPTPVPEQVLLAQAKATIHHRTGEFRAILKDVSEDLKYVFQTRNDVLILASSGTGAMEAAVANIVQDGIKFIPVVGGKFGERWLDLCRIFKADFDTLEVESGRAPEIKDIEQKLKNSKKPSVILTTLCETSTGAVYDIEGICKIAKKYDAFIVVDAISGLVADKLKMDDWGIDIVVSGSQKGLMLPPGLAFISLSDRAFKLTEGGSMPKYYFDLTKAKKTAAKSDTPWTPAVNMIVALKAALEMIKEEGIENIWDRHASLAKITRQAVVSLGLKIFAQNPSNAVTSVSMPKEMDSDKMVKFIREEFGISIAGGQSELKGKIFRIAHLGYVNIFDILAGIAAVEFALHSFGYKFNLGSGILKLEEEFLKSYKKGE